MFSPTSWLLSFALCSSAAADREARTVRVAGAPASASFERVEVQGDEVRPVDRGPGRACRGNVRGALHSAGDSCQPRVRQGEAAGVVHAIIQCQRLLEVVARRDVAEAQRAVAFPNHGADLAVERQRKLIRRARRCVVRVSQRDVAEAHEAVGLAQHGADLAAGIGQGLQRCGQGR